jgi:natural product biosynthesis luciferase-like monooxygenase protein
MVEQQNSDQKGIDKNSMLNVLSVLKELSKFGIFVYVEDGKLKTKSDKSALTSNVIELIKSNKDALIEYLTNAELELTTEFKITKQQRNTEDPIVLSYAQQRLWMLDKIEGGSSHYNIPVALELKGELDPVAFEEAFRSILARHESLRTVFREKGGEPVQVITSAEQFSVSLEDLTKLEEYLRKETIIMRLQAEALAPFDLSQDLMLRVNLLKSEEQVHIALVTMHHIASDGWSSGILIKEFSELYSARVVGRHSQLQELAVQYADYAHCQRNWLQGEVLDKQLDYWEKQLAGIPVVHSLPLDKPRPKEQGFTGGVKTSKIEKTASDALNQHCQAAGATLFMGLHAVFSVLLSRYSNETDIVIGSPIANREQAEVAGLIGFFMNTLILRSDLSGCPDFDHLLAQSKEMLLDAYAHQQVSFEQIVERLKPQRSLSHSPLFQVMLVLQNNENSELTLPDLSLSALANEEVMAKYDLTLTVVEEDDGLFLQWEYSSSLFEGETIERMSTHFNQLLTQLVGAPQESVFTIPMLSERERVDQLVNWNDTAQAYQQDKCIHELFEEQVAAQPNEVALVFEDQRLTYIELNGQANQLARYLIQEKGIKPNSLVGICVERSLDMVVAILGILKAGGAYVPLDPNYPEARLVYMLEDAQLATVISDSDARRNTPISQEKAVCLDDKSVQERFANYAKDNLAVSELGLSSSDLAYVIYTSGSTGQPKGVMVEHRNLNCFIQGMSPVFVEEKGIWLAVTMLSFDISTLELLGTLINGYKVIVAPEQGLKLSFMEKQQPIKPMEFGLFFFGNYQPEHNESLYHLLLESAKFADENGFSAIWTPERHYTEFGGHFPNPAVTGAAIAAVTERISIRSGSVVLPINNPVKIAEDWSVIDNLSNGRVGLSLASGWNVNDFVFAKDAYENRHQQLFESVDTIRSLWNGEGFDATNVRGEEVKLNVYPRPVQESLPLWLTIGGNPEGFIQAGKKGLNVLTHLLGQTFGELAEKIALYREAWNEAGHQGRGHISLMVHTFVGDDDEQSLQSVKAPFKKYLFSSFDILKQFEIEGVEADESLDMDMLLELAFNRYARSSALFGGIETCIEKSRHIQALDIDELGCLLDFGVPAEKVLASLPRLKQVMDAFNVKSKPRESVIDLVERHKVTHMQCTPSFANALLAVSDETPRLASLKRLLLGGEALPEQLAREMKDKTQAVLHNLYGPTEASVWATSHEYNVDDSEVYIGQPIKNYKVFVVDANFQLVPQGVPGELLIAGDGVARGYLNRDELTNTLFIDNPFGEGKAYLTGDLVCWTKDGLLKYLTRKDNQLKISGYRIEPGEIEAAIEQLDTIDKAIVVCTGEGDNRKLAACVINNEGTLDINFARQQLRALLPQHMIPSNWTQLDGFPLTANGKIDRKVLAQTQFQIDVPLKTVVTTMEQELAQIWSDLLKIEVTKVGRDSNFFALGGHSLLSLTLLNRIKDTYQVNLEFADLITQESLMALAEFISFKINEVQRTEQFRAVSQAVKQEGDAESLVI